MVQSWRRLVNGVVRPSVYRWVDLIHCIAGFNPRSIKGELRVGYRAVPIDKSELQGRLCGVLLAVHDGSGVCQLDIGVESSVHRFDRGRVV